MKVRALASLPHYVDHLAPVWRALPPGARGAFHAPADAALSRALQLGVDAVPDRPEGDDLTLVSATVDYRAVTGPVIYLNHGVGQGWRSTSGTLVPVGAAAPRPNAVLFLAPGPHAAAVTLEANPGARVVTVGSPKLDAWLGHRPREELLVVSTHWDHQVAPEARSVLRHYLPVLRDAGLPVALHAHPRISDRVEQLAGDLGLEFIATFEEVLARASVYATDSSSTLFEFAATGRPVVVLNGPDYRREHSHGLRFWDAAEVGVNVTDPADFAAAVQCAVLDPPEQQEARARALSLAYAPLDGQATRWAVDAILELIAEAPEEARCADPVPPEPAPEPGEDA